MATPKPLIERNRELLYELQPQCHWAAEKWLTTCFNEGKEFRVLEVYRSQERQNELYAQGRWKPGNIVTWTLYSNHTQRLAADIYPLTCTYEEVAEVGKRYGVTHPIPFDKPHFEFDQCRTFEPSYSASERLKQLERGIARALARGLHGVVDMLERVRERLLGRSE